MYVEVLSTMAERLGMPLERVDTEHRVFPASTDLQTGAGRIPQGRVSHFNWRWRGIVQGQPGVRISLDMETRAGDTSPTSAEQIAVAGSVINAIPIVCAAPRRPAS